MLSSGPSRSDAEKQSTVDLQKQIQTAVLTGKGWDSIPPGLRKQADIPWFQSFLAFDPAKPMADIRQPILIVQGLLDTQVAPSNADRLEQLARGRKKAAPVEVAKIPGVNHLLVPATHRRSRRVRLAVGEDRQPGGGRGDRRLAAKDVRRDEKVAVSPPRGQTSPRVADTRGERLAAFDGRCIPARGVAPPSNTPGILRRRALRSGRLAGLGATPDFHHGLLRYG